jgi:hypothetical protein
MPAEYLVRGHVSEKTDAFAFGIVVGELVTGLDGRETRELLEGAKGTDGHGTLNNTRLEPKCFTYVYAVCLSVHV